jgi:hypothetical protein
MNKKRKKLCNCFVLTILSFLSIFILIRFITWYYIRYDNRLFFTGNVVNGKKNRKLDFWIIVDVHFVPYEKEDFVFSIFNI